MPAQTPGIVALAGQDRYEYVRDLSAGAHGFVQLAKDTTNHEQVAIKFLPRGEQTVNEYVLRELLHHRLLLHPHIIQFKEVFLTDDHLAIVMEYADRGDMFHHVIAAGGYSERDCRWFFQQLILGVDYAHKMGVCSRDIKLENALCDGSQRPLLKLCDFGYSKSTMNSLPKSNVGTLGYAAPEVMAGHRQYCGQAADIWSCGCVLYALAFCRYPFERSDDPPAARRANIMRRSRRADYVVPTMIKECPTSQELKHLLSRMLTPNPNDRAKMNEIWSSAWFSTDLPEPARTLNERCINMGHQAGHQSEEELHRIWQAGRSSSTQSDLIADVIDDYDVDESMAP
ncbi:hypothetical protein WJX74_001869 [Apatococcus lobatus]|uniref:Protein kinase domain-containing protein n=1 Tax=Apatococcus lobatus TaxID=904363 RepID=A0AAW1Q2T3_9CHLO